MQLIPVTNAVVQHHILKKNNLEISFKIQYLNRTKMFLLDVKTKDFELLGTKIVLGKYQVHKDFALNCICTYKSTADPYAFDDFSIDRTRLYLV